MLSVGRIAVLCLLFTYVYANGFRKTKDMQHLLSLFGYRHGLKFGQNYVSYTPHIFIQAPIFFVPKLTQQQSVILLSASTDEPYHELNDANTIKPLKVNVSKDQVKIEKTENSKKILHEDDQINKIFNEEPHQNLKRDISNKNKNDTILNKINLRQSNFTNNSSVMAISTMKKDSNNSLNAPDNQNTTGSTESVYNTTTTTQSTANNTTQTPVSTLPSGVYPLPKYNNSFINEIIFTTPSTHISEGDHNANMVPRDDEKWRNFSSKSGNIYPSFEGFKPLAGLYYDGFLHKMLIKENGWSPLLN